ncbi:MAG: glycosyl transferase family 4 [Nanoarchaeota archaeon]|nr:glycosyl transferase family 4 [Nanoarchaeota archaeon]
MEFIIYLPIFASFLVTLFIIPYWIIKAKSIKLVWDDMNKPKKQKVAGSGGLTVIFGFTLAILLYISIFTFIWKTTDTLVIIFALLTSILILGGIGIVDDLLGWKKGGLSKKFRLIICAFAAIPLIVVNAGEASVNLPFLNGTNLGLFYPLLLIPVAIIGTSTTFNFLAGFNGLEAGQGIIIISALSFVSYMTGNTWLALIGLMLVASLLAFLIYNKYPAKIFPGDSLTYPVGGMIAIMAIFGNMERIALFFFIPYIIEVGLKARGRLKKQSFGKPKKDGSLILRYNKIYGLEHFAIWMLSKFKKNVYEKEVVYFIHAIQIAFIIFGLIIFRESIFI